LIKHSKNYSVVVVVVVVVFLIFLRHVYLRNEVGSCEARPKISSNLSKPCEYESS
jgi:hypothetical protein